MCFLYRFPNSVDIILIFTITQRLCKRKDYKIGFPGPPISTPMINNSKMSIKSPYANVHKAEQSSLVFQIFCMCIIIYSIMAKLRDPTQ